MRAGGVAALVLASCALGAAAQDAPPPGAQAKEEAKQEAKADGWRYSGNATFTAGFQQENPASVFGVAGPTSHLSYNRSKAAVVLRANLPRRASLMFDGQIEHFDANDSSDRRINQLYAAFDLSPEWKLRLGKQRVLWGRGFSYIPTDFVNPPLDPSGLDLAKVGVTAISADYVRQGYAVTLLARGEEKHHVDSFGVKFAPNIWSGVDLDFIYYHAPSIGDALGSSFALDAGQRISSKLAGLVVMGGVAVHRKSRYPELQAGSIGGTSFFTPGPTGRVGPYTSWMLAGTYDFNDRVSMTAEMYRIGDAYGTGDYSSLINCLADRAAPCAGLSAAWLPQLAYGRIQQRYATLQLSVMSLTEGKQRLTDTLGFDAGVLRGRDGSAQWTLSLRSNYFDNAEITWRNFFPVGGARTEFGSAPYRWFSELGLQLAF